MRVACRPFLSTCLAVAAIFVCGSRVFAQATDLRALYEQIHAENRLDAMGQTPFYIKISAQLYDLEGKPASTATIEEWWDRGRYRIELNGPSGTEVQTSLPDSPRLAPTRSGFLLHELLNQSVNPLNQLRPEEHFKSVDRDLNGVAYRCLTPLNEKGESTGTFFCAPAGSNTLVFISHGNVSATVRNQIARFHGSMIALKTSRAYLGKPSVSGEVTALKLFDATQSTQPEFAPEARGSDEQEIKAGQIVRRESATVPSLPGLGSATGFAYLIVGITPSGSVSSAEVIASNSSIVATAAVNAVRRWVFTPSTRDGVPVNGTVTTAFNLSR